MQTCLAIIAAVSVRPIHHSIGESILVLLGLVCLLVLLGLYVYSLVWVYRDAKKRGKPGLVVVLLVALLSWPLSLLLWWLVRGDTKEGGGAPPVRNASPRKCPQCGAALAVDAPQGLCPACLLKGGLETGSVAGETGGQPPAAGYVPPTPAELARYFPELEILELVGRGGMGAVYKARQKRLDRLVALKILPSSVGRDAAFAERFAREARALARLTHPNIVTVHDFGQSDGLFYFLMEFVDGMNLRQLLNTAKIAPKEALAIVPQICDALQYAHDKGIVHRDIKPENILLDKSGAVKIADFGLAKLMGREAKDLTITGKGDVMGTPHYMAPEQVEHPKDVDHRADIYSLGVVFYQMLTGELPIGRFAAPSKKVVIDVRLDEVVLHALEKEPERRYQQASQVKTDVETIVGTLPPPAAGLAAKAGIVPPSFPITARKATSDKTILPTFLLAFFFGVFGAHRFYVGKIGTAILQLCTFGACGIWATIDWILILCKAFTDGEGKRITEWIHPHPDELKTGAGTIAGTPPTLPLYGVASSAPANSGQPTNDRTPAEVRGKVVAPAVGLLLAATLKLFSSSAILSTFASSFLSFLEVLGFHLSPEWRSLIDVCVVAFMVVPALLVLLGAVNMLRLRGYGWAILAAILAIVFPPWHLVGIPMGIWALVMLTRHEVREAFARQPKPQSTFARSWPWLLVTAMGAIIVVMLALNLPGGKPNVTMAGLVTDAAMGQPIAGARVADNIYNAKPNRPPQETWTDAEGRFTLNTWYEEHTIAASASGYRTGLATLVTKPFAREKAVRMDFQLQPMKAAAQALPSSPATINTQPSAKKKLVALVEDFFRHNFRDVTSRETIEWGGVTTAENGNSSIRYKYRAKTWDKDTVTNNQVFTFDPQGKFLSVKDVEILVIERQINKLVGEFPVESNLSTPEAACAAWQRANAHKDAQATSRLSWVPLDPAEKENWYRREEARDPEGLAIYLKALGESKIVEVQTWRGELANVITFLPFPAGKGRDPYSARFFGRINGEWKNLGEDRLPTLEVARADFEEKKERLWHQFEELQKSHEAITSAASGLQFGPVIERVVNDPDDDTHSACLDLDSGELFDLPVPWPAPPASEQAVSNAWNALIPVVTQKGIDVVSDASGSSMQVFLWSTVPVSNEVFDAITPAALANDNELNRRATRGGTMEVCETLTITNPPATYLFKTRDGNYGVMQIAGFTDNPRGVKIRYKLVPLQAGLGQGAGTQTTVSVESPPQPEAQGNYGEPYTHRTRLIGDLLTKDEVWQTFNQTLPLAGGGRLSLDNVNGQIEIIGWDRDEVVIKAVKRGKTRESVEAVQIEVDARPERIVIHTWQPASGLWSWLWQGRDDVSVHYTIQVPQHARLEKITSVNGEIVIEDVSGDIKATTVNGEVRAKGAAGNLKLSTVNGKVAAVLGSLGSGQSVSLDTVNGRIEVTLPEAADAEVSATAVNGSITSEFSSLTVKRGFPLGGNLKGTLGNGGARVKASAVNGDITIQRGGTAKSERLNPKGE